MLPNNRRYDFVAEVILNRSRVLDKQIQPKDDKSNWLFLNTGKQQFSFVYRIKNPLAARYGQAFTIELAFTMFELAKEIVRPNYTYQVLRGPEIIGTAKIIRALD
jgi:hypothetical protein